MGRGASAIRTGAVCHGIKKCNVKKVVLEELFDLGFVRALAGPPRLKIRGGKKKNVSVEPLVLAVIELLVEYTPIYIEFRVDLFESTKCINSNPFVLASGREVLPMESHLADCLACVGRLWKLIFFYGPLDIYAHLSVDNCCCRPYAPGVTSHTELTVAHSVYVL